MPSTVSLQFKTVLRNHAIISVERPKFVASCAFRASFVLWFSTSNQQPVYFCPLSEIQTHVM